MEQTAITTHQPGVYGVSVLECPYSPRCRYVVRGKTMVIDEFGRLIEQTVYLHALSEDTYLWYRCAEYDGQPTAYCDTREQAEELYRQVVAQEPRTLAPEEEPDELLQAA